MLAKVILMLVLLEVLTMLSEQKTLKKPPTERESIVPLFIKGDTAHGTRTYRSTGHSNSRPQTEQDYKKEQELNEHTIPLGSERIIVGEPDNILQIARRRRK